MSYQRVLILVLMFTSLFVQAQDKGVFSGNFQSNFSVFLKDTSIGADERVSPQYGKQISSAEAWLYVNYDFKGFHMAARYDLFNNSNLINPSGVYNGMGIGFYQLQKSIGDLELTAGYFYDQFGSGIIFRAYENRLIGIDYAIQGVHLKYRVGDHMVIKAFTGRQRDWFDRFTTSPQVIKGVNIEEGFNIGDWRINLGASGIQRTLDENTVSLLVAEINGYPLEDRFEPRYNVYAMNGYFNATWKGFGIMAEYNRKTQEAIRLNNGEFGLRDGSVIYTGLSWSKRKMGKEKNAGIGINVQYRRIEDFPLLNTPFANLLAGFITYQPSLTRQASYRLVARYQAAAQFLGEQAIQGELVYSFNKNTNIQLNYANIETLAVDSTPADHLYTEYFTQLEHKFNKHWKGKLGFQSVFYNQGIYQGEPLYPDVVTYTPFFEITYKHDRKNSIRLESQYLHTTSDLGSFYNGILEWNHSPLFTIAVGDMINTAPQRQENQIIAKKVLHYPTFFVKYNVGTTSFTASYVQQVEGVNCTGGICRLEPAFSGLKFTLATQF